MENLSEVEKAAIEWAKQREKYFKSSSLGKASSRKALKKKADELSFLALNLALNLKNIES
jgi:hypothetical protein